MCGKKIYIGESYNYIENEVGAAEHVDKEDFVIICFDCLDSTDNKEIKRLGEIFLSLEKL